MPHSLLTPSSLNSAFLPHKSPKHALSRTWLTEVRPHPGSHTCSKPLSIWPSDWCGEVLGVAGSVQRGPLLFVQLLGSGQVPIKLLVTFLTAPNSFEVILQRGISRAKTSSQDIQAGCVPEFREVMEPRAETSVSYSWGLLLSSVSVSLFFIFLVTQDWYHWL